MALWNVILAFFILHMPFSRIGTLITVMHTSQEERSSFISTGFIGRVRFGSCIGTVTCGLNGDSVTYFEWQQLDSSAANVFRNEPMLRDSLPTDRWDRLFSGNTHNEDTLTFIQLRNLLTKEYGVPKSYGVGGVECMWESPSSKVKVDIMYREGKITVGCE
jgi:hypothetical protein